MRLHAFERRREVAGGGLDLVARELAGRRRHSACATWRSRTFGSGRTSATLLAKATAPRTRSAPAGEHSSNSVPASFSDGTGFPQTIMFERGLHADHARQALRAAGARQQAELHFRQRDLRARQRHAVVAAQRQLQAAAHAHAVDRGDHRLGRPSSACGSGCAGSARASAFGEPNSRMSAPPENALPAPVMTIGLDGRVVLGALQAPRRRRCGSPAEAVDRRVVQRDDGDVVLDLVIGAHGSPL